MKFSAEYPLSIRFNNRDIDFHVQGDPEEGRFCITCSNPIFDNRFNGETKCFQPFISAPFIPDATDEHYDFFVQMKMSILKAHAALKA